MLCSSHTPNRCLTSSATTRSGARAAMQSSGKRGSLSSLPSIQTQVRRLQLPFASRRLHSATSQSARCCSTQQQATSSLAQASSLTRHVHAPRVGHVPTCSRVHVLMTQYSRARRVSTLRSTTQTETRAAPCQCPLSQQVPKQLPHPFCLRPS